MWLQRSNPKELTHRRSRDAKREETLRPCRPSQPWAEWDKPRPPSQRIHSLLSHFERSFSDNFNWSETLRSRNGDRLRPRSRRSPFNTQLHKVVPASNFVQGSHQLKILVLFQTKYHLNWFSVKFYGNFCCFSSVAVNNKAAEWSARLQRRLRWRFVVHNAHDAGFAQLQLSRRSFCWEQNHLRFSKLSTLRNCHVYLCHLVARTQRFGVSHSTCISFHRIQQALEHGRE